MTLKQGAFAEPEAVIEVEETSPAVETLKTVDTSELDKTDVGKAVKALLQHANLI